MIAVCGIGNPRGWRNSATTAYQSARPPIAAASAKAAMKPNAGCTPTRDLEIANSASAPTSTRVAWVLTRRSSAARAASPGVSSEKEPVFINPELCGRAVKRRLAKREPPVVDDQVRSGGLADDLREVVLYGLSTIGNQLAEIISGRLRTADEHFAARARQVGLDLHRFAERLGR